MNFFKIGGMSVGVIFCMIVGFGVCSPPSSCLFEAGSESKVSQLLHSCLSAEALPPEVLPSLWGLSGYSARSKWEENQSLLFCHIMCSSLSLDETEQNRGRPPFFVVLTLLCKLLNQHISEAKKDLVSSSMSSPMYGIIQSIRATYECLGTAAATYARDCRHHREAMATIVSICHDVAELVSPVVCTSSPEGFLPDREGEKEPYFTEDSLSPVESRGNAQSLLLCCWHSMKEIALLLGYLTEYAPVISDATSVEQEGVITHGQVSKIRSTEQVELCMYIVHGCDAYLCDLL